MEGKSKGREHDGGRKGRDAKEWEVGITNLNRRYASYLPL